MGRVGLGLLVCVLGWLGWVKENGPTVNSGLSCRPSGPHIFLLHKVIVRATTSVQYTCVEIAYKITTVFASLSASTS